MKKFGLAMIAGLTAALDCPEGTLYMSTSLGCGCKFPEIMEFNKETNTCECLDKTLSWGNNGEACGLTAEQKTAAVQWIRTRWQPWNDAGTRKASDMEYLEAWTKEKLE